MASRLGLKDQLDRALAIYNEEFAGQQRDARDVARLDEITREARAVMSVLERRIGPMRPDERALFGKARTWVALFVDERRAILEEKALPAHTPERLHIAEPGTRANAYTSLLRARFHPGAERIDLALVTEAIEGLERFEADMVARTPDITEPWMRTNLPNLRAMLLGCRAQLAQLTNAWSTGGNDLRRKFLLQLGADLSYFTDWEAKFIAAPAHRHARYAHVAAAFDTIVARVRSLGALDGATGDQIAPFVERRDRALSQRAALAEGRAALDDAARIILLDREVASVNAAYRKNFAKKLREKVDLPLLRRIVHRASSLAIQAADLWNEHPHAQTEAFRMKVRARLSSYENEERMVTEAQAGRRGKR